MSKFYITTNDGEGWGRVSWLRPFDTEADAEEYLANCSEGSWDGQVRVEEVEE